MGMKIASILYCQKQTLSFWSNKIERNKARDKKEQRQLAAMGWHCITIWECQLKPKVRRQTLESLAYTLNYIFLEDRKLRTYKQPDTAGTLLAAEAEVAYERKNQG